MRVRYVNIEREQGYNDHFLASGPPFGLLWYTAFGGLLTADRFPHAGPYAPTSAITFSVTKASIVSPTFTSLKF